MVVSTSFVPLAAWWVRPFELLGAGNPALRTGLKNVGPLGLALRFGYEGAEVGSRRGTRQSQTDPIQGHQPGGRR